jgi:hydrogenase-1 operon protein HyaF
MSSPDTNPVCSGVETGNVEPLLHEIRHALRRLADGADGTVIDLKRLPPAPGEEERIEETLGIGEVRAEVDALGPTLIQETSYPGVWLITHKNADGVTVARFIEVTYIPELLRSQQADIDAGIDRLQDELRN